MFSVGTGSGATAAAVHETSAARRRRAGGRGAGTAARVRAVRVTLGEVTSVDREEQWRTGVMSRVERGFRARRRARRAGQDARGLRSREGRAFASR